MTDIRLISRLGADNKVGVDMGFSFDHEGKIVVLGSDGNDPTMIPNCIGVLRKDRVGWYIDWCEDDREVPLPIFDPGLGETGSGRNESCTPCGGISVDGVIYAYMSRYKWEQGNRQTCYLIKSVDGGKTFTQVWEDRVIGSVCPIMVNGEVMLFLTDDSFKFSNIYFNKVDPHNIERQIPSSLLRPIIRTNTDYCSVYFDEVRKIYVLSWWDHRYPDQHWRQDHYMSHSKDLISWSEPVKVMDFYDELPWFETMPSRRERGKLWNCPYGGTFVHSMCTPEKAVYMLSLNKPYDLFLVEVNWKDIF